MEALNPVLAGIQNQSVTVQAQQAQQTHLLAQVQAQLAIHTLLLARASNASAIADAHTLVPVPRADGEMPPLDLLFPATRGAIHGLTNQQCNQLLAFYDLPHGGNNVAPKQRRLFAHLGLRDISIHTQATLI
jgi:hypothetical protein